jgi:hypothetical protein
MITLKDEMRHLHNLLKHRDKWYIDVQCLDVDVLTDIAESARENANYGLQKMSLGALYNRYLKWREEDKIMSPDADYYREFLNQVVWDLGLDSLRGRDKDMFCDSINLTINFI